MSNQVPTTAEARSPVFLPELESMRGLAALAVVVEHCFNYSGGPALGWLERNSSLSGVGLWLLHLIFNGRAAVVLFFVISGFVLARQLDGLFAGNHPRLQSYFVRRFFRIVPAMWAAVVFAYMLAMHFRPELTVNASLLLRTLLLQDITLDVPLWSLHVEIVCCAVFPLLYLFNQDAGRKTSFVSVLLLAPLLLMPIGGLTLSGALRYLVFFQLGILIATHGVTLVEAVSRTWRRPLFLLSCLMLSLSFMLWPFFEAFTFFNDTYPMLMAIPFSFVILAYVVHGDDPVVQGLLGSRMARFVGKISFSLYLVHYMIVNALLPIFGSSAYLSFLWPYPLLQGLLLFVFVLSLSLPLAILMYHLVEVPFSNLGRRLSSWSTARRTVSRRLPNFSGE